jgi:hypothetical protein
VDAGSIARQVVMRAVCSAWLATFIAVVNLNEAVGQVIHLVNFVGCSQNITVAKDCEDYLLGLWWWSQCSSLSIDQRIYQKLVRYC